MKIQEVILRAVAKKITWAQAGEIIGLCERQMRRWKERYEEFGYDGLFDHRLGKPSPKRVPLATVEEILRLYQEQYEDFNVRQFHEKLREKHHIRLSYTWVKRALQMAGLVKKSGKRGVHRRRRPRRPLAGMLLHLDGSSHAWFQDDRRYDLLVILDDATSEIYYAQLVEEESTATVMTALREVIERKGAFCALYSDRASHFFHTRKAGQPVDRSRPTQVGRALQELGIQMIPAYSPQARGRSERSFGTWQGRLPQELRLQGIRSLASANEFLRESYIEEFNKRFAVAASEPGHAFLPVRGKSLDLIFSLQHERTVNQDNTVHLGSRILQIEKTRWRATLAGCRVTIYEHLDGSCTIGYGPHIVGRYQRDGLARLLESPARAQPLGKRGSLRSPRLPRLNTTNQPLTPKPNRTLHVL
ncbi:MAG TPA: ISNCY family transposase [Candidatus Solibacter sp.]|nr:ISNCY family transposase [Candidatus Solibacter sp.]